MKAVGLCRYLSISDENSLQDLECDRPVAKGRGLLVEVKTLQTTCNQIVKPINSDNLRAGHRQIETGRTVGKVVLADWR